jgi:HAD superfamily hydrolase (TIGR01509 family)
MNELTIHVDLDNTLIETSKALIDSYFDAVNRFGGKFNTETEFRILEGESYEVFLKNCFKDSEEVNLREVQSYKKKIYPIHFDKTKINRNLLNLILSHKAQRSVVTNASRTTTFDLLKYHSIDNHFNLVVTREDVLNPKPDPEAYLISIQKLPALMHVAFEDSTIGILSATKAGCLVFKVSEI